MIGVVVVLGCWLAAGIATAASYSAIATCYKRAARRTR